MKRWLPVVLLAGAMVLLAGCKGRGDSEEPQAAMPKAPTKATKAVAAGELGPGVYKLDGFVCVTAFYPGNEDHQWVRDYLKQLEDKHPGKVKTRFVAFNTDEGATEWQEAGLECGTWFIDGESEVTFTQDGKEKTVWFVKEEGGEWSEADLFAAVADRVSKLSAGGAAASSTGPLSGTVVVLVPCGMQGPYGKARALFKESHPDLKVEQDVQNIEVLIHGIVSGKFTGDIVLSMGDRETAFLNDKGKLARDPVRLARNTLGMIVPNSNPAGIRGFKDLANAKVKTLGLPDPELISAGYYGKQALEKAGLWESLAKRVSLVKSPAALKGDLASGKMQAAITFGTCMTEAKTVGGEPTKSDKTDAIDYVPQEYYDEFYCTGAVLKSAKNPSAAEAFLQFMTTEPVQKIFAEYGLKTIE
ncbi:MAG TPA: substrate-binding domain-containing protein [Armatimonadota bacterium]|nr:substrate-binding domain-containing protein [Armatimonadota bacterium]